MSRLNTDEPTSGGLSTGRELVINQQPVQVSDVNSVVSPELSDPGPLFEYHTVTIRAVKTCGKLHSMLN